MICQTSVKIKNYNMLLSFYLYLQDNPYLQDNLYLRDNPCFKIMIVIRFQIFR